MVVNTLMVRHVIQHTSNAKRPSPSVQRRALAALSVMPGSVAYSGGQPPTAGMDSTFGSLAQNVREAA